MPTGNVEDLRAHDVGTALPHDQQQKVSILWRKVADRSHDRGGVGGGVQAAGDLEQRIARYPLEGAGPSPRPKSSLLGPPVAAEQVGRDPEQPGALGSASRVEPVDLSDRGFEHVGQHVERQIGSEPSRQVEVDGIDVVVVQASRVGAVGGRFGRAHIPLLPDHEDEFTQTPGKRLLADVADVDEAAVDESLLADVGATARCRGGLWRGACPRAWRRRERRGSRDPRRSGRQESVAGQAAPPPTGRDHPTVRRR